MSSSLAENVFVRRAFKVWKKLHPGWLPRERREILARMDELVNQRPIHVNLELNTACNAKCTFCAYPKVKREYANLSLELFEKICRDFAALGGGLLGLSALISDPLLDPHLLTRLRHISENHSNLKPHVFTNGIRFSHYSDADLEYLLENLEYVNISIGGLNREDYLQMFGVDMFERVWESLERLARIRNSRLARCKLYLHVRTHRKQAVERDPKLDYLRGLGYLCDDVIDTFSDWGGIVRAEHLPEGTKLAVIDNAHQKTACLIPMTYLSVLPDGRCNACGCMDTSTDFIVGDMNTQSIVEVWQSPAYRQFRSSFQEGRVHRLCRHCSYYSSYADALSQPRFKSYVPWNSIWAE